MDNKKKIGNAQRYKNISIILIFIIVASCLFFQGFKINQLEKSLDNKYLITNARITNISNQINTKDTLKNQKYMHISLDDTIDVFKNLTENKDKYASIFQDPTLAYLKSLHDKYGAVISLYCFYNFDDFKLSNTTDKFRSQFTQNSDWLKFGFHSIGSTGDSKSSNYANTTSTKAKNDYDLVINQLLRITGSYKCIDRVPRLENFAGNLNSVNAIKSSKYGIEGLLGADDSRNSYYLTKQNSKDLKNKDEYKDLNNKIMFFSTDLRMESIKNIDTALEKFDNINKPLIIFTHEWKLNDKGIKDKIDKSCQYAIKHGYGFDFPMNNLNLYWK